MVCSRSPENRYHEKSFRINDKFLSHLMSKESQSQSHPSFRVYYGDVSSAVPFTWETRPGTPKHPSSCPRSDDNPFPPLTPPPSYHIHSPNNNNHLIKHKSTSSGRRPNLLFHNLIKRRINPNPNSSSGSSSSSSFSTLSWSSSARSFVADDPTPLANKGRRRFASWGSYGDRQQDFQGSKDGRRGHCKGSYSMSMMYIKKAFLSIIGHRASSNPK